MRREPVLLTVLIIVLAGTLELTSIVQRVEASGTIYIRADGSIDGPANITTVDYVTYYFNESNYDEIVVERDNMIIDGANYTLQGAGGMAGTGLNLTSRSNVTIKNMEINSFFYHIYLYNSSNNRFSGNNITRLRALNNYGIYLDRSSNNTISGNNITDHSVGIALEHANYNTISGNNITANDDYGILLWYSSNHNTISRNNVTNNGQGIYLHYFATNISLPTTRFPETA